MGFPNYLAENNSRWVDMLLKSINCTHSLKYLFLICMIKLLLENCSSCKILAYTILGVSFL